ncbi:18146_t:CDS:1, partial [Gigaspora rosea]
MRDMLNQRIILYPKNGIYDHKELANFGALGYQTEISFYLCKIHKERIVFANMEGLNFLQFG